MSRASVAWLRRELPKLVAAGVLSPEAADALRRHYAASGLGRRLAAAILTVLGALLVGGGVVLLLAHNWDDLSRTARAGILVALLVAAQALSAFALVRQWRSVTWRESAGGLQMAAVASAVALVAQTYHVPGDLAGFYRTVLLLTIPLVYLLESAAVSVLTWGMLVALSTTGLFHDPGVLTWWGLAAAGVPFPVLLARREGDGWRAALTIVTAVVALFVGGTINAGRSDWEGLWVLYSLGLLAIVHALGSAEEDGAWRRRLRAPAYVGLVVVGVMLTFEWPWKEVAAGLPAQAEAGVWATAAVAIALGLWATWLAVHLIRTGEFHLGMTSAAWVAGALAYALALADVAPAARLVFDLWLAAVGITGLAEGWRSGRLGRANAGLLALAGLALARFFDADVSFLLRGLGFIGVGVSFLVTNLLLVRKTRTRVEVAP